MTRLRRPDDDGASSRASARQETLLAHLERIGLLLESDKELPSVASIIAGEPIAGSWWGHPKGQEIFNTLGRLMDHPDVLTAKLVSGKVTLVHRALWPHVLAMATCGEAWQTDRLSAAAKTLLKRVRRDELLRTTGDDVRELERRLLVLGTSVHTETGDHAKALSTWERWAAETKTRASDVAAARRALEDALTRLGGGRLPWQASAARKQRSRGKA